MKDRAYRHLLQEHVERLQREGYSTLHIRQAWNELSQEKPPKDLPKVVGEDAFIRAYARGKSEDLFRKVEERLAAGGFPETALLPFTFGGNADSSEYYDVKATPPGLLPKLFAKRRKKEDSHLLEQVQSDLTRIAKEDDLEKRRIVTLAILTHGATYRELEGRTLHIPSLEHRERRSIPYLFHEHLIWEGVKTVSCVPMAFEDTERGIYLCQGTEIWPSQPSVLGSLFANTGKEGSATEPYAYSWRQIHRHLRNLTKSEGFLPVVAGHSMGGALATQIALYSHPLIHQAYAFNPPVVEERDYVVYHSLSAAAAAKLIVYANLDDLPFWRIGSKVIGKVSIFLAERRWKYRPIHTWEFFTLFPALVKAIINLVASFPSHQSIYLLQPHYLIFPLSQAEIDVENAERLLRPDHISIIPLLHNLGRRVVSFRRKHFHWSKRVEYLKSELEILELHEHDLHETLGIVGNGENIKTLEKIAEQKALLLAELSTYLKDDK